MQRYTIAVSLKRMDPHAGSKAPLDVRRILESCGYQTLCLLLCGKELPLRERVSALLRNRRALKAFLREMEPGSLLFLQAPMPMYVYLGGGVAGFLRNCRKRGIRVLSLFHDIEELRGGLPERGRPFKRMRFRLLFGLPHQRIVKSSEACIAHNDRMQSFLEREGMPAERIVTLSLFDYLMDRDAPFLSPQKKREVAVAGNLSPEKAGFLYRIPEKGDVRYFLFGSGYREQAENAVYCGTVPPEELPRQLRGSFGLVWDGEDPETCAGPYGEYLRYNSPHKASLYLAAGLPLLVWKQSALAGLVEREQVGLTVQGLSEIGPKIDALSEDKYRQMCENARRLGRKIRDGVFLRDALNRAEAVIEEANSHAV